MMHRPTSAKYNSENGLVDLRFASDSECEKRNPDCKTCKLLKEILKTSDQRNVDIPHYVRGAIVWPVGRYPGYALVSAQNIRSPEREIKILEESPFWSVGTLRGESGIWSFLEKCLKKYHCQYYFYVKSPEHRRYFIQVQRELLIKIKPYLIEAKLATESEEGVNNLIHEYQRLGKLKIDEDFKWFPSIEEDYRNDSFSLLEGNLRKQLDMFVDGHVDDENSLPGVKALRALVAGYERVPYRGPVI